MNWKLSFKKSRYLLFGLAAALLLPQLLWAQDVKPRETRKKRERLDRTVNSNREDYAPLLSIDGSTLYFARKYHPLNTGGKEDIDIWMTSVGSDGQLSPAVNIGAPLNTVNHEWVCGVAPSGRKLLIAPSVGFSRWYNFSWKPPVALELPESIEKKDENNYFLSSDGNTLIISMNAESSAGKRDLYAAFMQPDGRFGDPVNLGTTLNSGEDDYAPFLAADGVTLYFSSYRRDGMGGADVYMSRRLDDTWTNWTAPANLGSNVNSRRNDDFLTVSGDGSLAYLSSDKYRARKTDLFKVELKEEHLPYKSVLMNVQVFNATEVKPLKSIVVVKLNDEETSYYTDDMGEVSIPLRIGEYYEITAENDKYTPQTIDVNLRKQHIFRVMNQRFFLKVDPAYVPPVKPVTPPVEPESDEDKDKEEDKDQDEEEVKPVPEPNADSLAKAMAAEKAVKDFEKTLGIIYFSFDEVDLRPEAKELLKRVGKMMKEHDFLHLRLEGHTDALGAAEYNQQLSLQRAARAKEYLIDGGVKEEQIRAVGFGEEFHVAPNDTEANRAKNRRVEMKSIKK